MFPGPLLSNVFVGNARNVVTTLNIRIRFFDGYTKSAAKMRIEEFIPTTSQDQLFWNQVVHLSDLH